MYNIHETHTHAHTLTHTHTHTHTQRRYTFKQGNKHTPLTKDTHRSCDINDGNLPVLPLLVVISSLLGHQGPQLVQVHRGTVVLLTSQVKVSHADFPKVSRMAVEVDRWTESQQDFIPYSLCV